MIRFLSFQFTKVVIFLAVFSFPALAENVFLTSPPDYAKKASWIFLSEKTENPVDVFFMHPTTYFDTSDGMNASLENPGVNAASKQAAQHQGGVFKGRCNLFAPRYRQASMAVLNLDEKTRNHYLRIGLEDMATAFAYYMAHYNQGRPVIFAGHSQGSNLTLWFLKENITAGLREKLVAAYIIGWSVRDSDLEKLGMPLSAAPDQTGCVITWNTISDGGKSPVIVDGARCVNPLSWSTDDTFIPGVKNIGARIQLADNSIRQIPHFTGSKIDLVQGGLVIPTPSIDKLLKHGMGPGVYHGYDYDFFYENLRENVGVRCDAWFKKD